MQRQLMRTISTWAALLAAALGLALAMPASAQFSDGYNFIKAVKERDVAKAKALIDKPGSTIINARDGDSGDSALVVTIKRRDAPWMAFLLQNGADPNMKDGQGNPPIVVAAMTAFPDGVRLMLAGKAQVDAANGRGETALIKAVQMKDATSVQLLLAAGADPDRRDSFAGMSAREYAERDVRSGPVARMMAEAPKKARTETVGPRP